MQRVEKTAAARASGRRHVRRVTGFVALGATGATAFLAGGIALGARAGSGVATPAVSTHAATTVAKRTTAATHSVAKTTTEAVTTTTTTTAPVIAASSAPSSSSSAPVASSGGS